MKKFLFAAVMFAAVCSSASAQDKTKMKEKNNYEELNLTAAQKSSMDSIRTVFKTQITELKNSNMSEEDKKAKMKELNHSRMTAMNGVLTEEQRKQMKAKMKEKAKQEG